MTGREVGELRYMRERNKRIRYLNAKIKRTYDSRRLSPQDKRRKIDSLQLEIGEVARGVLGRKGSGKLGGN